MHLTYSFLTLSPVHVNFPAFPYFDSPTVSTTSFGNEQDYKNYVNYISMFAP